MALVPFQPRLVLMVLAALLVAGASTAQAQEFDGADADRVLSVARQQLARTAGVVPATQSPKATRSDGTWTTVPNTNLIGWTQGFFPGSMWLLHKAGGESVWRTRADSWTRNLELQKTNTQTHDLGFKFMLSFGHAYQLTGDTYYRDVLLTAAGSLAARFNSTVGVIDCCDWNTAWDVPMVVDTMMNLELLFWASRNGGRPEWNDMALRHAMKTRANLVRADGSTFHVVDYDGTGRIRSQGTFQGYSDGSTWARGQAWAIYGFTMAYRYTRDPIMLETAQRTANYYLGRLPADGVPFWDFDVPASQQLKDSSSAAIVASALLELSEYVAEPDKTRYRAAALRMLETLASSAYLASGTSTYAILNHGVGNYPAGQEIDVGLIYGDYYFLEAVLRFKALSTARVSSFGATWRYDDRGVDPGAQWTSPSFNDSTWKSGPGQLGYGDGDEATLLTKTPLSQPSVYFRRHVTLSGPVTQAALRVIHDDGVAVWVNGQQVFSKYVANGTAHGTYASAASADNELSLGTIPLSPNPFREGDNVIAVMVKQSSSSSSDLSFDLELTATTAPPSRPRVTVVSPNGGEVLRPGSVYTLLWSSSGAIANVRLEFSADNGATWQPITGSAPNTGQYAWTVPAVTTSQARIRVSDAGNASVNDISDAAFSIVTESVIRPIVFGDTWRYDDRGLDPGSQWRTLTFTEPGWKTGIGQLGYGDGDERTVLVRTSPAQPSVYFRKKITLSAPVTGAQLSALHDDGIAVWVNGTLVFSKYVGNGTSHSVYASATSLDNEQSSATIPAAPFVVGDNIIAVMVKQSSGTSSDISFDLALTLTVGESPPPPAEETVVPIALGSSWKYDDTGMDRGTAWLAPGYDDAAWGMGAAQLGYGDGDEATVLRRTPVVPSYYFRRQIQVTGQVTQAQLRVLFDDGAAVWVNGRLVFSRNMGNGTSYSAFASASAENTVADTPLDLSTNPFVQGTNAVTVMVKQSSLESSDVSFDLSLTLRVRR